ncbi:type I DNA topoisomerase [bacterium]|nr:type I DNA topoisomerase [bacterium]
MSKSLVIVESPTKAKTITKFLGKDYVVKASFGHVRDLPTSAAEIPAKVKKEPWSRLGINVDNDFEALYVVPAGKKDSVKDLQNALKDAEILYLATDEDREGESISWHLLETLKPKVPVKRLVFHEITKEAIKAAIEHPRDIDENLVRAQETRRLVDRLYGYEISPLLWKKMAAGLSAGRVQSVAVRLLVDRERERIAFKKAAFWGLRATFAKGSEAFDAELTHLAGTRVATGKDFDPNTGAPVIGVTVVNQEQAEKLVHKLAGSDATVSSVEEKPFTQRPAPPFVTSSLQQEANRKLRLSAKRTMQIAQQLYENGLITYMRTDSVTLSTQAIDAARNLIRDSYGKDYLPNEARIYKTSVKNAQEAHEAIRPAGDAFTSIEAVRDQLGPEAAKVYELIWKRTVASQMKDATGTYITVEVDVDQAKFRASGKTIQFPGFLRAYVEGSDDPEADIADQERILPQVSKNENLGRGQYEALERSTQAPARYTEGSLIKELEKRGIGRPSTWATVVDLVLSRDYAFKKNNALVPTFTALAVIGLLEKHFGKLLDYEFTARLEDDLDAISRGEAGSVDYLKHFYFGNGHAGLKGLVQSGEKDIDPREVCGMPLKDSDKLEVRIGKYGPFLSNGTARASIPEGLCPDELTLDAAQTLIESAERGPESIGTDPETAKAIYVKTGRFGPYVQRGESGGEGEEKPKMVSLLKGMQPADVTLELALQLLALPRTLGTNPDNSEVITAAVGRFGPYIKCGSEYRSIPADAEYNVLTINFDQALELARQPKVSRRGAPTKPKALREVGVHPVTEKKISLFEGRYGPYVSDGEINASLRKGMSVTELTLDEAVNLLNERAAKGPVQKKSRKRSDKAATKKSTGKSKKPKASSEADANIVE